MSGTAGYVAPEVIDGEEPGAVADRWAWAATMAFAMTGKAPYGTGNSAIRKTLQGKWAVPDLPGADVLAAALDRKVEARPGMRDVVAAMRGATTVLPVETLAATAVMETSPDGTDVLEVDAGEDYADDALADDARADDDGEARTDAATTTKTSKARATCKPSTSTVRSSTTWCFPAARLSRANPNSQRGGPSS